MRAGEPGEFFLSSKQCTILTISHQPNFTKLENNTLIGVVMNSVGTESWKFSHKGYFFQKKCKKNLKFFQGLATSGCHNSQLLQIDGNLLPNDPSSFHFYRWNQFKVIPWPVDSVQETYPKSFFVVRGDFTHADALSGRGLTTSLRQGEDRSFDKITRNWVMTCTSIGTLATQRR